MEAGRAVQCLSEDDDPSYYYILYEQQQSASVIMELDQSLFWLHGRDAISQLRLSTSLCDPRAGCVTCLNHGPDSVGADMKAMLGGLPILRVTLCMMRYMEYGPRLRETWQCLSEVDPSYFKILYN
jgi:hypothetical protein